jgi:hypothetical protein
VQVALQRDPAHRTSALCLCDQRSPAGVSCIPSQEGKRCVVPQSAVPWHVGPGSAMLRGGSFQTAQSEGGHPAGTRSHLFQHQVDSVYLFMVNAHVIRLLCRHHTFEDALRCGHTHVWNSAEKASVESCAGPRQWSQLQILGPATTACDHCVIPRWKVTLTTSRFSEQPAGMYMTSGVTLLAASAAPPRHHVVQRAD